MLEYGSKFVPGQVLPQLLYRRMVIPTEQVKTLFSSPVTLIPANPTLGFIPGDFWTVHKPAGVAYTLGASTNLLIQAGAVTLMQIATNISLNVAGAYTIYMLGPGVSSVNAIFASTQFINVPITMSIAGGNVSVGDSPLIINFTFRAVQNAPSGWM